VSTNFLSTPLGHSYLLCFPLDWFQREKHLRESEIEDGIVIKRED
jgi:hypothetical protein